MIFNDLALFTAVATHLNFSEAARQTGIPLSRVSRRIAELEGHLGEKLFERSTRKVRLTAEGKYLLDRCQHPFEQLGDIAGFSQDTRKQEIHITAPSLAVRTRIGALLLRYAKDNPDISIKLSTTNHKLDFFRDNIDLAFRLGPLSDSSLIAQRLWRVPYCFCASETFIARHSLALPLDKVQLESLPAITSGQPWLLHQGERLQLNNVRHEFDELSLIRDAVALDMGVAMLPEDILLPNMRSLPLRDGQVLHRDMYAVYPSKRLIPARVRHLIDFMQALSAGE